MQELDKILEEIKTSSVYAETADKFGAMCVSVGTIERIIRKYMNDKAEDGGWIPVKERLPEEKINPVTMDFYEYLVTARFGNVIDVRCYKYGDGHWWHGPGIVDKYVVAWQPLPEPYRQDGNI